MPVKNFWECGQWKEGFHLKDITRQYGVRRSACFGCNVHCHTLYEVKEGEYAGVTGGGPEYETVNAFGGKCLCSDMPAILYMNRLCAEYGLDTVSTGNIIALLMDLYDKGKISEKATAISSWRPFSWTCATAFTARF